MKIGIVVNPKSRRNLRDPSAAARLEKRLGSRGLLRAARSKDELHAIATEFLAAGIDVLAIGGGDGTNHVTLTGFLDVYGARALPPLALLRGGTMNTVANACHVPRGSPDDLLDRLLRVKNVRDLKTTERHVMRIGADYGFLFGVGVVHGFMAEYYKDGEPTPLVAAETLLRGIGSTMVQGATIRRIAKPFRGRVDFPGSPRASWPDRDYLAIAGGTIDQIGLGFRPFGRAGERGVNGESAFHLLGIHTSPAGFVRELPRVRLGKPLPPDKAIDVVTASARIVQDGPQDAELAYMIDGDLHSTTGALDLSIGPRLHVVIS